MTPSTGNGDLTIQNVSKYFVHRDSETKTSEQRLVLGDVSFTVPKNKFVVLFGPNASGKTTLLKIVAGIEKQNNGEILLPHPEAKIDLIFQNYRESLYPWLTVIENICFPLEIKGVSKPEREERAIKLLGKIGASILSENEYSKYPYQLSGGQQQLVAFARSLIGNPDILLLDESFAALDHDTRYLMQDALTHAWEEMKFHVVFISHSVWEAVYMADIVVLLSNKPAKVLDIIEIPLPRPRKREVEYSQDFFDLRSKILRVFEKELYDGQ